MVGWTNVDRGDLHLIARVSSHSMVGSEEVYARQVRFSPNAEELRFSWVRGWDSTFLASAKLDGSGYRVIAKGGREVRAIVPTEDLSQAILFDWNDGAWIAPLPSTSPDESRAEPRLIWLGASLG